MVNEKQLGFSFKLKRVFVLYCGEICQCYHFGNNGVIPCEAWDSKAWIGSPYSREQFFLAVGKDDIFDTKKEVQKALNKWLDEQINNHQEEIKKLKSRKF